jgi:hypothetical protein
MGHSSRLYRRGHDVDFVWEIARMSIWIPGVVTVAALLLTGLLLAGSKGSFSNMDPASCWIMFGIAIIVALFWILYGVPR